MKRLSVLFFVAAFLLHSCDFPTEVDLFNVKNPEDDIYQIYDEFELESITKEYTDADDYMDIVISGYANDGYWDEFYFINNGDDSYTFYTYDEYWDYEYDDYEYYDDYDDDYENVEAYFDDIYDDSNELIDVKYADIDGDGYEDGLAVVHYMAEDYESIDAYIFLNNGEDDERFYYYGLAEVHYPLESGSSHEYRDMVVDGSYFSFEFEGNNPNWERITTFKYDEDYEEFLLHKDGGQVFDEEGGISKEAVLDEYDFGIIYFNEYFANEDDYFSLNPEVYVSNVEEFYDALGSNKTIYLEEGKYVLNDINQFTADIQKANAEADGSWDQFYTSDYFYLTGGYYDDYIETTISNLSNTKIIGKGNVELVVTDEMLTVLSFQDCDHVTVENIYFVHEVGGECGANVIDLEYCDDMDFYDVTFDGSGQIGLVAYESYNIISENCSFTNCTDGAISFSGSYGDFYDCSINDNTIWNSLIYAGNYSDLYFYNCDIQGNEGYYAYDERDDDIYLFEADDDSYIYLDYECVVRNNEVDRTVNDRYRVEIDDY